MPEWIHLSWCVLKMHHGVLSRRWAWEKSWNLRRKRQLRVIRCKSLFLSCHVLLKIFSQDEYILVESCYLLLKYLKTLIIGWVLFCKLLSSTVIWYKIIKKKKSLKDFELNVIICTALFFHGSLAPSCVSAGIMYSCWCTHF